MAGELLKFDMSFSKLMENTMASLKGTELNHVSPGSVTKLILSKVNEQIAGFYSHLEVGIVQAFLSVADDAGLELIGKMTNCPRYTGESTENYRYRISMQPLALEKANETAIRLAVLSVPDVKDVILKEFAQGTGSFAVYPIVDNPKLMKQDFLDGIHNIVSGVKSFGTKAVVLRPRLSAVEIRAKLLFNERSPEIDRNITTSYATDHIRLYLASLLPGGTLSPEQLKNEILEIDDKLVNVEFYHFRINDKPMVVTDQISAWNEQFVESDVPGAILVS